ncbi:hypothetical protein FRC14_005340 [Serendipita sp. 396]|nr:hypothetical protein FRC14_005340 [Serendipita sp. 396]KAG8847378.1 hypothetical protein FRB91_011833 [Serendipita sp. 411]
MALLQSALTGNSWEQKVECKNVMFEYSSRHDGESTSDDLAGHDWGQGDDGVGKLDASGECLWSTNKIQDERDNAAGTKAVDRSGYSLDSSPAQPQAIRNS